MDKTISSSCNNDDGVPEELGMEKVLSDLQALKKLYGLLPRLDETSKALLKKLLDDATCQALLKQANALTASDPVIPFSLGLASPKKLNGGTLSTSLFLNNKETEMEQILSDLQALTRLYSLLHKGPADENLDEASRALLMKILEDATQEAVRRQAKMLSGSLVPPALETKQLSLRSDCRTRQADPRLRPVASPRPSLMASEKSRLRPVASPKPSLVASERSRQLNLQHSTVSSLSSLPADGHRRAAEEPPLARHASKRSSRTALPAQHCPSQEQQHSSLSLRCFIPVGRTSRHGTVTASTRLADRRDSIRRSSSGHGDQWSVERSISSSRSRSRCSVPRRELSLGPSSSSRLHDRATPRHVAKESSSSVSVSPFERLDSALSRSTTSSRHGVQHADRRRRATPGRSSSSNTVATIQSRIRPSSALLTERRSAAGERTPRRRRQGGGVHSDDDTYSSMSSGSRSSSAASTSPPAPVPAPAPHGFATPYCYSPPVMTRGGVAPPAYTHAPEVSSRSMRRRRPQEVLEKRVARLRMLKEKIATVIHHRHDHHHHHHIGGGQESAGPSTSRSVVRDAGHHNSPWQFLWSMFHHTKGKVKNARSRAVAGVQEKRRGGGGGGNLHALFDAVRRHLKGKRRRAPAPAGVKLRRKASRVRPKMMHWWQRLRQRRGMLTAGSKPRRRLGQGKKSWL